MQDDQRAVGTQMNEDIAKAVLENQQTYTGKADLLGVPHLTTYIPLRDTEENVVGAIFAGLSQVSMRQATMKTVLHLALASLGILVICTLILFLFTRKSIKRPMDMLTEVATQLAHGNLDVNVSGASGKKKDEIGMLTDAMVQMISQLKLYIADISKNLSSMARKDFSTESTLSYVGDFAPIESSLREISLSLNETFSQINLAAEQVATGSDQVSSGAQALASGATEQAATVEELNASAEQIVSQAEETLVATMDAAKSGEQVGIDVDSSNEHMAQLSQAMSDINTTSDQIADITKVIEDIAFQTNILALNAAVEAARAGNAGKGFAVVAEEVRNLAAKSAEAAKQTGQLIQTSVDAVERGAKLTDQTEQLLQEAGVSSSKVRESFEKIGKAMAEQTQAIESMREGISQISSVVQNNAATAEENSATSEEMSAQADMLRREVGAFKLADAHTKISSPLLGADVARLERPMSIDKGGFGKY